ncbi:CHAT domain-containing protein [Thermomonospora echinospora]|uniref:CHAT domain-containing protein n=1 Tax=Thermomonospora echinospora TaxID=1992 RepID=A0A1H5XU60_9ACTN|nr:CHAT domain-containing protein [Thermomonospora echinospora]SEG14977.1 CHAT domain-containing protein [Thermomonospora echinospora]
MTTALLRLAAADPARAHAVAAEALDGAAPGPPRTLIGLRRAAALAAKELGRLEEGLAHLDEALRIADAAGLDYERAQVRMSQVGLLAAHGDLSAALECAAAAAGVLRGADADRLAANRACALARAGRPDDALAVVREALPRLRRGDDPATLVGLLINLGLARALCGGLETAQASLAEAVAVADRAGLRSQAAMARGNLAFVVSRRGDLPQALHLYAAAEPGLTGERVVQCRLDQAETLIAAGLTGEARPLLAQSLAEAADRGYRCDVADGLLLLACAELADGDAERATQTAEQARTAFAEQERTGWMLLAEHLLLRARWAAGDRSPLLLRTAVATAGRLERGGWAEPAADIRIVAARLALHLGRPAQGLLEQAGRARRRGPAALRVAAWHATALERSVAGDRRGALAAVRSGLRVAGEHAEVFGAAELRARAARVGEDLAALGLDLARSARELLAAEERRRAIARRAVAVRPPADPQRARALAELRVASAEQAAAVARGEEPPHGARRLARLEAAVRTATRRHSPARGRSRPRPAGAAALVAALGDRALVELVQVGDGLHVVTITGGRCRRWPIGPYDAVAADARLVRFAVRRLARHDDETAARGLRDAVRRMSSWTPAGLHRALEGRELVIAPTGAFHAVPWAALVERPFTVVPSATAWLHAVRDAGVRPGRVVLAAGPSLPQGEAEVLALAHRYPDATVLHGPAADVASVRRALDGADLAHLAAHGEFREDNPLFSHLRLADGPLLAYDLEDVPTAPRMVVLSACDAGQAAGDGVLGIVGVLLGLGTATVIASVTPVRDAGARAFMTALHERLRQGTAPARAMSQVPRSSGDLGFQCYGAG